MDATPEIILQLASVSGDCEGARRAHPRSAARYSVFGRRIDARREGYARTVARSELSSFPQQNFCCKNSFLSRVA